MLKAIIVEDEKISQEILVNYLLKYCKDIEVAAIADDVPKAVEALKKHPCDVLFLDIELPFGNAFDVLEQVSSQDFETIFVTAYQQYAIEALNAHAAYYLLKPISIDELIKAVNYVKSIIDKENQLQYLPISSKNKSIEGKITIGVQDGFEILEIQEILYCKADDNYTEIYLPSGKKLVSKTLKHFENQLKDYGFARIHKSCLVNVNHIQKYKKGKGGSIILRNGVELAVAPGRKKELLDWLTG